MMTEASDISTASSGWARRVVRTVLVVILASVTTVVLALVVSRLYFHDERLRQIAADELEERFGLKVGIEALELRLLSGFTLRGLSIGSIADADGTIATIERLRVNYEPWALTRGTLHLRDVAVENILIEIEHSGGSSDTLDERSDDLAPRTAPNAEETTSEVPELLVPSLPVELVVERFQVGPVAVHLDTEEHQVKLDRIYLESKARISDDSYRGRVHVRLGDDEPSHLAFKGRGGRLLQAEQVVDIELGVVGLDDLSITAKADATLAPDVEIGLPPTPAAMQVAMRADLLGQKISVDELEIRVGDYTELHASLAATDFMSEVGFSVDFLRFESNLNEIEVFIRSRLPQFRGEGRVGVTLEPFDFGVDAITRPEELGMAAKVSFEDVSVAFASSSIERSDGQARVELVGGRIASRGEITVGGLRQGTLNLEAGKVSYDFQSPSIDNEEFDAQLVVTSGAVALALDEEAALELPALSFRSRIERRGIRFTVAELEFAASDLLHVSGNIDASALSSNTPQVQSAHLEIQARRLERILATLPPSFRAGHAVRGRAEMAIDIAGEIPTDALVAVGSSWTFDGSWTERVDKIGKSLEDVAKLFSDGLSVSATCVLDVDDLAFTTGDTALHGLDFTLTLSALDYGVRWDTELYLAEFAGAVGAKKASISSSVTFLDDAITVRFDGRAARLQGPGLRQALENTEFDTSLVYDVNGALELEAFEFSAQDGDLFLRSRFYVQDPIQAVRRESLVRAGMPGVDIDAEIHAGLKLRDGGVVSLPGTSLVGRLDFDSTMIVRDGLLQSTGRLGVNKLSMAYDEVSLSDADGDIPFQFVMATEDREGFSALPFRVPFGDGTLRIRVDRPDSGAGSQLLYPALRSYRDVTGIKIASLESKGFRAENLELDGVLEDATVDVPRARLSLLGGDILGTFALNLLAKNTIKGSTDIKVSNIDASYFPALNLEPGPDSEVDADGSIDFVISPDRRDLGVDLNVTSIGRKALDRFLQLLDPAEQNQAIQRTRFWLNLARIKGVSAWLAYDNLNVDLDAESVLTIPYTSIGFPSFERELIRREPMGERLDVVLDPIVERVFRPFIGASKRD